MRVALITKLPNCKFMIDNRRRVLVGLFHCILKDSFQLGSMNNVGPRQTNFNTTKICTKKLRALKTDLSSAIARANSLTEK